MRLRLHACIEVDDETYMHKNYYITDDCGEIQFVTEQGWKQINSIITKTLTQFFDTFDRDMKSDTIYEKSLLKIEV